MAFTKKTIKRIIIWVSVVILVLGVPFAVLRWILGGTYETNRVGDYLKIEGNFTNEEPRKFVTSFFPATIEESFSDVRYHYKAVRGDNYACETYLEFVISDTEEYKRFIDSHVDRSACKEFSYDKNFFEHSISDGYALNEEIRRNSRIYYTVEDARVGKILFSDKEQRVIFVAIDVWAGGATKANSLNYFFKRFGIEPKEFATLILS